MILSLTDQRSRFPYLLSDFKLKPLSFQDPSTFPKRTSSRTISLRRSPKSLEDLDCSFLLRYCVFPSNMLVHLADWEVETREMRVGDTILQQTFLPPLPHMSLKLIVAVRVLAGC